MRALRAPGFAPLLVGQAVNAIGSWVAIIAIWGFAAFEFDAGPADLALLFVVLSLPGALLGPLLGVWIDRVGPRRALIAANLLGAGAALLLVRADSYLSIILLALPLGLIEALAAASLDAVPPRLVDDEDLVSANALLGGAQDLAIVIGPLLAAVVDARWGLAGAFVTDAVTFLVGAAVALHLPATPAHVDEDAEAAPTTAVRELRDGLGLVRRTPALRWGLGVAGTVYALWGVFGVLEPLYVRDVLEESDTTFALMQTVFGVGLVSTGLVVARLGDRSADPRWVARAVIASGATAALYVGTTSLAVAYGAVLAWGVLVALFYAPTKTLLQRWTPVAMHGRVLSLNQALEPASEMASTPLAALLVTTFSVPVVGAIAGASVAIVGTVAHRRAARLGPVPDRRAVDPTAGSSRDAIALGGQAPG